MFEVPAGAKAWMIIFHPRSTWWIERLCPDKWKHVSAVGFVPEANSWMLLSWELGRMRACVIPDAEFPAWLGKWCGEGVGVLRVAAPDFDEGAWRPRLGLFCVSMVCHLLGLRGGALLPSGLWRLLIANGAEVATDGRPNLAEDPSDEADCGRADSGGGRRYRAA